MSIYTKVSEPHIDCSHVGFRSPLLLRVETSWDTGSFVLSEYEGRRPYIEMDGETEPTRRYFSYVISSLSQYLTNHFMTDLPTLRDHPGRYEIDLRRHDYRFLMAECGESGYYRSLIFGTHDITRIRKDLWEAHRRLAEIHHILYQGALYPEF